MPTLINMYKVSFTGTTTFNFPQIPALGNSLIYVFDFQGHNVILTNDNYNSGAGPHDVDFGHLWGTSVTTTSAGGGGNGTTVYSIWTQGVQATFNSVTFSALDNGGIGVGVPTFLLIYEVSGLIGQVSGDPTIWNSNPALDINHALLRTANGSLTALGDDAFFNPNSTNCFPCTPPCDTYEHQVKFLLTVNKDVVIGNTAIPNCDLFNGGGEGPPQGCDPCNGVYVPDDFVFALCGTGTGDAANVLDNVSGNWVIDWQPVNSFGSRQIFARMAPAATFCGGMTSQVVGQPTIKGTALAS